MEQHEIKKDEWGIVLEFLAKGHIGMQRSQPVAQVLGDKYFSLLEVIIREGSTVATGERLYIGDKKRDKVKYIQGRIGMENLLSAAKEELPKSIETVVDKNPEQFIQFFNESGPLTTRMHQLELLPGIGKKHLWKVLEERKVEKFKSFEDIKNRVPMIPDPKKMIVKRIEAELENKDRYYLFALKPKEALQEEFRR